MLAAVQRTVTALDPPERDAALVALAEYVACVLDGLHGGLLDAMVGQTAPQLLKVLQELEGRSVRRAGRVAAGPVRRNKVAQLRAVHQADKRRHAG